MGQPNEKEDPIVLLDILNSYEEKYGNALYPKMFVSLRNIIDEYLNYKNILDKNPRKKFGLSPLRKKSDNKLNNFSNDMYDKNKIDEINHKFERINKWIKMAKTPYYSNLNFIFNKIKGKDKKLSNKVLSNIGSTKNIFQDNLHNNLLDNDRIRKLTDANNVPKLNNKLKNDNSENIIIVKKKLKKNKSFDNSSIISNQDENNSNKKKFSYLKNYTDKVIEEKIISFYINNKSKFMERVFKGPPESFRWISWCIINEIPLERDISLYNNYMTKNLEKENKDRIIRDIERTFSDKNINNDELRKKETSLYNILKAYWNLDKDIGYCQGMNLIVGFLLLVSNGNELDSFFLLISNFSSTFKERKKYDYSFRGLFSEEFPLLYFFNFIFDILLQEYIPEVKNHLDEMGITYDLWIGQWFQTLFTIILPLNWCKRLWDCIYSENIFFVIKFGIAFTRILKDDIMNKTEEIDIIDYFKDLRKFSLCPENNYLDQKIDINTLIIRASKIKLDPEDYIKIYKKKEENFDNFNRKMEKNQKISYLLEYGNYLLVEDKVKHRQTVLFKDEKEIKEMKDEKENEEENGNENIKDSANLKTSNKLEIKEKISRENDNYDPKENKIKIHINKSALKNDSDEKNNEKKLDTLQNVINSDNNKKEKNDNITINNLEITPEKRKNYFLDTDKNSAQIIDNNIPIPNKNNAQNYYPQTEFQKKTQNLYNNQTKKNVNQKNLYANYFGNYYQNQYNQATYSPPRRQNNLNYNINNVNINNNRLNSPSNININNKKVKYIDINNYYNNTNNATSNKFNNNIDNVIINMKAIYNNNNNLNNANNMNKINDYNNNLNNNFNKTNNINNNKINYNMNINMNNTNSNLINNYNNNYNNKNINCNMNNKKINNYNNNNMNNKINNLNINPNNFYNNQANNNLNNYYSNMNNYYNTKDLYNNTNPNSNNFNNINKTNPNSNYSNNNQNNLINHNINYNKFNNMNYNYNNNYINNNQFNTKGVNPYNTDNNFFQNQGNCKVIKIIKKPKNDQIADNVIKLPPKNNYL